MSAKRVALLAMACALLSFGLLAVEIGAWQLCGAFRF